MNHRDTFGRCSLQRCEQVKAVGINLAHRLFQRRRFCRERRIVAMQQEPLFTNQLCEPGDFVGQLAGSDLIRSGVGNQRLEFENKF